MKKDIFDDFPISGEEFQELEAKFGKLCYYAAHQLRKNNRHNYVDDLDDIYQELQSSIVEAGCYYKRQLYVEKSLLTAREFVEDVFIKNIVEELQKLWDNRTRHGANRQKYGKFQEEILERIIKKQVPKKMRPNKKTPLVIDAKFSTYAKAIAWNKLKNMGKKITREKPVRNGQISLSEYDYLAYI